MSRYICYDAVFGLGSYALTVEADDHEEAAAKFARRLHQDGEQYASYVVGVICPDGQAWRCTVEPRFALTFGVTATKEGATCAA